MLTKISINKLNFTFMIIRIIFWVEIARFHWQPQYSYPKNIISALLYVVKWTPNTHQYTLLPTPHTPLCLSLLLIIHHFEFTWTTCQNFYKSEPRKLTRDKLSICWGFLFFEISLKCWNCTYTSTSFILFKGTHFLVVRVIFYHVTKVIKRYNTTSCKR